MFPAFLLKAACCCLPLVCACPVRAQIRLEGYRQSEIDPRLFSGRWSAWWISAPGVEDGTYGVCHFRKEFRLSEAPRRFVVHVSADSRYRLYVNGIPVSTGPACGDVLNWNFETVDLAPCLTAGRNVVAAVVWNFADKRPLAQISFGKTAFLLQGDTPREEVVNTDASWSALRNDAYSPNERPVFGYYAAGACERVVAAEYPWGWERPDYDASHWRPAVARIAAAMKGAADYPGWQLVPSPVPPMETETVRIPCVRQFENVSIPGRFPAERAPVTVPARTEAEMLLDNRVLTTGYPLLHYSGGCGAEISLGYAEALYEDPVRGIKGNRDRTEGKHFVGYEDVIVADGASGRMFSPLWWRTWRYLRIRVRTSDEPLTIDDIRAVTSMYPLRRESEFRAEEDPVLHEILETGWRTARLCAHESYMDCPYYEQLQYFGDARIQAMITMFNTRDDRLVRCALEQGRRSLVPDGITMSRYPSSLHQFIPSFSLWWIVMGHDYWMYRGGEEYLRTLLPAWRSILSWFEQYLRPDLSLRRIPYWFFADWSGTPLGEPRREEEGDSAFQDLMYVYALRAASRMEAAFGSPAAAEKYSGLADAISDTMRPKYWDARKGMFADTFSRSDFSQHVNVLAILCGVVEGEEASALLHRITDDRTVMPCSVFFRYYLQQAMKLTGNGAMLFDGLGIWRDQLALGLTTWAEQPEPSRSDCHAWSASPNIEFYRIILGIDSDAPGFRRVRIEPSLGGLRRVSGAVPHPAGKIGVDYEADGRGGLRARIDLPEGVAGTFVWWGKEYSLKEGRQVMTVR